MPSLAKAIKKKIETEGYEAWLGQLIEIERDPTEEGELPILCPVHDDATPSASFNVQKGMWLCHQPSCAAKGDCIDFYMQLKGLQTKREAINALALDLGILKLIDDAKVNQLHQQLLSRPEWVKQVTQWLGVSLDTVKRFQIGLALGANRSIRVATPIRGESGNWEDIRLYNPTLTPKVLSWAVGHGAPRPFPHDVIDTHERLFFMAGEKDTLRAQELGITGAFTVTAGEGTLPDGYKELFQNKIVAVCFDVDAAGRDAAERVANRLALVTKQVFILDLPAEGLPDNGDFSNWANLGNGLEEWQELLQTVREVKSPTKVTEEERQKEGLRTVGFEQAQVETLHGREVRFLAVVNGNSSGAKSYQVPSVVTLDCPQSADRFCRTCSLANLDPNQRPWRMQVAADREEYLQLFRTNRREQEVGLKAALGINGQCRLPVIQVLDKRATQHLMLSPPLQLDETHNTSDSYLSAFYDGPELVANTDYWFTGYLQADPRTQASVFNATSVEPATHSLDHFNVDDAVLDSVDRLQPRAGETLAECLDRLLKRVELDVAIWGQPLLCWAFLESMASPLQVSCGGKLIENGWIENLIIGDTGLAKTLCGKRILEMVRLGEYFSAETVSSVGLTGSVMKTDHGWVVRWGVLPRNDRAFLIVDEIDQLSKRGIMADLTAIRSNGWVEVNKAAVGRALCRVRTTWLTNTYRGRDISTYNGACRAIEELIPSKQDVSRFTKFYALSGDDVNVDVITDTRPRQIDPQFRDDLRNVLLLTWSLKAEQVRFTEEAVRLLRTETKRLTEKYDPTIPLLDKGRAFDKLSKLCCPVAALSGSFREVSGDLGLHIDTHHVQHAIRHLEELYDGPAVGFLAYSRTRKQMSQLLDPKAIAAKLAENRSGISKLAVVRFLLCHTTFRKDMLLDLVGFDNSGSGFWSFLISTNCLQSSGHDHGVYVKSKSFAQLVERLEREWSDE